MKAIRILLIFLWLFLCITVGMFSARASNVQSPEAYVKHELACYVYGQSSGVKGASVHAKRAKERKLPEAMLSYYLGYHTGELDVLSQVYSKQYGGKANARVFTASQGYKFLNCTTAGSM
jgi:hypothetical protein